MRCALLLLAVARISRADEAVVVADDAASIESANHTTRLSSQAVSNYTESERECVPRARAARACALSLRITCC